jgi:hypothetical protein
MFLAAGMEKMGWERLHFSSEGAGKICGLNGNRRRRKRHVYPSGSSP